MWVSGKWLDENRGTTAGKRKGRRQRGVWRRGIEWAWIDGEIQYNVAAIDAHAHSVAQQQMGPRIHGRKALQLT